MDNKKIHNETIEELYKKYETNSNGLTEKDAKERLEKYGINKLQEEPKESFFFKIFKQLTNMTMIFLNSIVLFSVVVSYVRDDSYIDSIIVGLISIVNTILGYYQSKTADKTIFEVNKMFDDDVIVIREGNKEKINIYNLVPGDIIELKEGDYIPCDGIIIESNTFHVNECLLTDNTKIIHKNNSNIISELEIEKRNNLVYCGSSVIKGTATILVCETGMNTKLGKIASSLLNKKENITPLQKKINEVSTIVIHVVLIIITLMIIIGLINKTDLFDILMLSILLMAAAIPESLSSIITITLSIGMNEMVKQNLLIKKMASVETLGSIDIVCAGKTTSLTKNDMKVESIYINNKLYKDINKIENGNLLNDCIHFCNSTNKENNEYLGNDIDIALYKYLENINYNSNNNILKINEKPFNYEKKIMEVMVKINEKEYSFIKGNPNIILNQSNKYLLNNQILELNNNVIEEITNIEKQMSSKSLEVIACAYKEQTEQNLTFIGLVGIIDPIIESTINAISICKKSGITPILITGNSIETAKAIAMKTQIINNENEIIEGTTIDNMTDNELANNISKYKAYASINTNTKLRIVEMLQAKGLIVAMIGDGVSDAIAIQKSNVGIGLGKNSIDIVKEIADCIVIDNRFSSIINGIEEGRKITSNIKKIIMYIITTNAIEVLLIFIASLFNVAMFTGTQIYWISLITGTIPAIMLSFEKTNDELMNALSKDNNSSFFTPFFTMKLISGVIIKTLIAIILYFYLLNKTDINIANSLIFIFLIFHEFLFAFSCKDLKKNIINKNMFNNKKLTLSIILLSIFQIIILISPLGEYFIIPYIEFKYILLTMIICIMVFIFEELTKPIHVKLFKDYLGGNINE